MSVKSVSRAAAAAIASVVSNSVQPHRRQPTKVPRPWDSPGKNTGVGCHVLLQCTSGKQCNVRAHKSLLIFAKTSKKNNSCS